uniref:Capsid protein n=1 Tax=Diplodia fraxini partitivirus 1 TaxID=3073354 RepID=A0AA51X332_9VIRU|nr:capsid protein [Diplodia fraxini partitivirus 1]
MSSSVIPNDSTSQQGRKSKPGKRERAQARSATGSAGGIPASSSKAAAFAAGSSDPVPMPGKFPIVFQTGAGEPTRDVEYAISTSETWQQIDGLKGKFHRNPKYAEFRAHTDITDARFGAHLAVSYLLRLAQQLVHAHVNMGLPQGDFAPVASSDVRVPSSLASVVSQYGEFSAPSIGTRFLLRDYEASVSRLVFAADKIWDHGNASQWVHRSWLPMSSQDGVTKVFLAAKLRALIERVDVSIVPNVLEEGVLSGTVPDAWNAIKEILGDPPGDGEVDVRDRFDFLFKSYTNVGQFVTAWTTPAADAALRELGVTWNNPQAGHLDWDYRPKTRFSVIADQWQKLAPAYAQFFELSSGLATRSAARGSAAQMVEVTTVEDVCVLKAHLALAAPEFSLAACFPPKCYFVGGLTRRVVLTTSLNVQQRATEFCQLDWR